MHLVLVDTTGIQTYIFGSNRLQENIGASYLVDKATGAWAADQFHQICPNQQPLYAGGGNFTALFDDIQQAQEFEKKLTRKVLTDAPGLQILVVSVERSDGKLSDDLNTAFQKMAKVKMERTRSSPLLGLGVTRPCASTGLPSAYPLRINDQPLFLSPEIFAKVHGFNTPLKANGTSKQIRDLAYDRLAGVLKIKKRHYGFPRDFEELGRSIHEQSYIAVVHADGNGMGDRIKAIGQKSLSDEVYAQEIGDFSQKVNNASLSALQKTLDNLIDSIIPAKKNVVTGKMIPPKIAHPTLEMTIPLLWSRKERAWMLPFRPIVFGGDDVTFVCDGRLGVALAVAFLEHFKTETEDFLGEAATACAGIAIVKSHYPFARAYHMAEELCKEAKDYRKTIRQVNPDWDGSCLDWHFALGGLSGALDVIRKREYLVQGQGMLVQRPLSLKQPPNPDDADRAWCFVSKQVHILQSEKWATKRNKLKALREVLRGGATEVKKFQKLFRQDLSALLPAHATDGWTSTRCVLFDAIELSDIHMPLKSQTPLAPPANQEIPR